MELFSENKRQDEKHGHYRRPSDDEELTGVAPIVNLIPSVEFFGGHKNSEYPGIDDA